MHKGIYQDKKTKKWYIHTTIQGKSCTIRGFNSKSEADANYDFEIENWKRGHLSATKNNEYKIVVDEFLSYRSKLVRKTSLYKDITQFKYYSAIFENDTLKNVFNDFRLKVIYKDIIDNEKFTSQKKMRLVLAFREFTKFCYLSQYISQDTYNSVLMVFVPVRENRQDRKSKRYIPQNDFKALLSVINTVNDKLFALAVFVLYSCGLRISELLGILGSDIDLTNKTINVKRQLQTNGNITTTLKTTNSYRQVPMTLELSHLFFDLKLNDLANKRVFPYSHTNFKRKLENYEKQANIPNYSCHEFRESFCTNLALKISNISEVSYCAKVSGHTTSMFLNTYVKSLDSEMVNKFF